MGKTNKKLIESPEHMWDLFVKYRSWCKSNPRIKIEYVGRDGERVATPVERPLTISGFANYCCEHVQGLTYPNIDRYLYDNQSENGASYKEFTAIGARIRSEIGTDQIEGGMVGIYNSTLTARLNNIVDRQEVVNTTSVHVLNVDPLAELQEPLKKLEE